MKILNLIKSRKLIAEGIQNSLFRKEHIEEVASTRMKICDSCPTKGNDCLVPGTGPCCNACGCSLNFKVRSLSSACPEGKWSELTSQEDEDLINDSLSKNE